MSEHSSEVSNGDRLPVPDRGYLAARRAYKRAERRAKNPLYLSLRSLAFTVMIALFAALASVALVFALRGQSSLSSSEPVIEVFDAAQALAALASATETSEAASAPIAEMQIVLAAGTPVSLQLAGPAIPTVVITNTPVPLALGLRVAVFDVGNQELNIRNIPSLTDSQVLFRAPAGREFDIIGGPQQADGFTWWQLRDTNPQFQVEGWAVANYLQTVSVGT